MPLTLEQQDAFRRADAAITEMLPAPRPGAVVELADVIEGDSFAAIVLAIECGGLPPNPWAPAE